MDKSMEMTGPQVSLCTGQGNRRTQPHAIHVRKPCLCAMIAPAVDECPCCTAQQCSRTAHPDHGKSGPGCSRPTSGLGARSGSGGSGAGAGPCARLPAHQGWLPGPSSAEDLHIQKKMESRPPDCLRAGTRMCEMGVGAPANVIQEHAYARISVMINGCHLRAGTCAPLGGGGGGGCSIPERN